MNNQKVLIGKKLLKVFLAENKYSIRFDFDGGSIIAYTYGDCCSCTWIEDVESPSHALGGIVQSVEDIDMPEKPYDKTEHDFLAFYGCKITTDKGSFVIDYRNSSNGYYSGSLTWPNDYLYEEARQQNADVDDSTKWNEVD